MNSSPIRTIYVRECWECGHLHTLNPADEPTLDAMWDRAWEIRNELRRAGASIADAWRQAWQQAQEEMGVRVEVVFRSYCGC